MVAEPVPEGRGKRLISTGNVISFEVEPHLGMRIVPITKAKA